MDWRQRFNISVGVARAMLYLPEDFRYRIIHRDLKVNNMLLDDDMNPKISDFGMPRIFGGNQAQANTKALFVCWNFFHEFLITSIEISGNSWFGKQ